MSPIVSVQSVCNKLLEKGKEGEERKLRVQVSEFGIFEKEHDDDDDMKGLGENNNNNNNIYNNQQQLLLSAAVACRLYMVYGIYDGSSSSFTRYTTLHYISHNKYLKDIYYKS